MIVLEKNKNYLSKIGWIVFLLLFLPLSHIGQEKTKKVPFSSSGNIQAGVEYGLLPFLVNIDPPQANFSTQGSVGFSVINLPFNVDFYYSSLGSISGLNNYMTVKFDANKFINDKKEALLADKLSKLDKIDSLNELKQGYLKKIDYYTLLASRKINYPTPKGYIPVYSKPSFNDSIEVFSNQNSDTLNTFNEINVPDSSDLYITTSNLSDSILIPYKPSMEELDSLRNEVAKYQTKIEEAEQLIEKYKAYQKLNIDSLAHAKKDESSSKGKQVFQDKLGNFFNGVKKFDIGMTYPHYSRFLISGIPIRGFNLEYELNNFYVAFTTGKTVNNIFITNNIINNNLNAVRNVANFFDFNNYSSGRKVTALKIGYGKKDGNHFYIGGLSGIGKSDYSDTSSIYDIEQNLVGELDGQFKIGEKQRFQALYGRSALQVNSIAYDDSISIIDKLVNFKDRTNALKLDYSLILNKTGFNAVYRLVDPFYKSYGVGFLRSDNQRFALKLDQEISKKLAINLNYRRENDNVIQLYNYQNVILTYGAGFTYRPIKKILFKGDFRPILQSTSLEDSSVLNTNNYITNLVFNFHHRIKKTNMLITAVNSYYRLSTENGLFEFFNININSTLDFNQKIINTTIINHYSTADTSSVPLASMFSNETSFKYKKITFSIKGKASFGQNNQLTFGYGGKVQYFPTKHFYVEASSEKLVLGDFYNSLLEYSDINYYYSYISIGIKW